ncbi:MAG: hypothetical protein JWL97_4228, partial [Gemmatimonadales bacterium]|nr:hypothetical protein [Gemmatimonadales bacterium]
MAAPSLPPLPGTIGLTRIHGIVGWLIVVGQLLIGDASRFSHAYIVVDDRLIVEAMPGGALLSPITKFSDRDVAYGWMVPLSDGERARIVDEALALVGTPYSVLDYVAMAMGRVGLRAGWVRKRVASSGHMICSQLVDEA